MNSHNVILQPAEREPVLVPEYQHGEWGQRLG